VPTLGEKPQEQHSAGVVDHQHPRGPTAIRLGIGHGYQPTKPPHPSCLSRGTPPSLRRVLRQDGHDQAAEARRATLLTIHADTTTTFTVPTRRDSKHAAELRGHKTQADQIRYACDQVPQPPVTRVVRQWLDVYGVHTTPSHASSIVRGTAASAGWPPPGRC